MTFALCFSYEISIEGIYIFSPPDYLDYRKIIKNVNKNVLRPNKTRDTRRVQSWSLREARFIGENSRRTAREAELMRLDKSPGRDCLDRPGKRS